MHPEYKRLPGRALITLAWRRGSLWMGPDHLLMVIRSGYTQEYKRFYYRDIQALSLRSTSTYAVLSYILGAISVAGIVLLWLGWAHWKWEEIWLFLWGAGAAFWILAMSYHLFRGATCECFIQTAVHLEQLVSLSRLRPARKTLRILREKIEEEQGILDPSQFEKILPAAPSFVPPSEHSVPADREYRGGAHGFLFSVLMLSGFLTLSNIFLPSRWIYASGYFLFALLLFLVILCLIRQHSANLSAGLKGVTGIVLVYLILFAFASYILMIVYSVENPGLTVDYWQLFLTISGEAPKKSIPLLILHIFSVGATWSLGITGMLLLIRFRSKPPALEYNQEISQ